MTWESMSGGLNSPNEILRINATSSPFPDVDYPRQPPVDDSVRINLGSQGAAPSAHSPPRYRGGRDTEAPNWDDDAALRLRTTLHPPGDVYDYLALVRKPLGLKKPNIHRSRYGSNEVKQFGVAWLVRDPCGIACIIITWLLIFYAELVVSAIILPRSPSTLFCWISGPIFHVLSFLAFISHLKAFSTDPGTIPIGNATNEVLSYLQATYGDAAPTVARCLKCLCIKPARAHHCSVCFRCVRKMDHHCPWINNCVGEANQKYFVLFTLYIFLQSLFALYICIHFTVQCVASDWERCQWNPNNNGFSSWIAIPVGSFAAGVFILGLVFEAVVFGLFTIIMCIGQLCSIADDETGIESLGRNPPKRERRSRWRNIVAACGSPLSWHWFNPFDRPPPPTPILPNFKAETYPLLNSSCSSSASTSTLDESPHHESYTNDPENSLLRFDTHARLVPGPKDILIL